METAYGPEEQGAYPEEGSAYNEEQDQYAGRNSSLRV